MIGANKDRRKETGQMGEDMAAHALGQQGYEILERNFRRRTGEIDIIAQKDGCLYFVEVRTKSGDKFGSAVESVGIVKRKQMQRIAEVYLSELGREVDCEFMVVAIDLSQKKLEIINDMLF